MTDEVQFPEKLPKNIEALFYIQRVGIDIKKLFYYSVIPSIMFK